LKIGIVFEFICQNMLVYLSKYRCFSLYTQKMKRKRLEMEYNLVDEYLNNRETETMKKLKELWVNREKKPLKSKPKTNATSGNRKSNP